MDEYDVHDILVKGGIYCSICGRQRWKIIIHRDKNGIIGFDGKCTDGVSVIHGWLPLFSGEIKITHNGSPRPSAIRIEP